VAEPPNEIGGADVFALSFALALAFMFANYLVNFVGQFAWTQIEFSVVGND
jgi:hypothetical protein